jgi:hypothetical protein
MRAAKRARTIAKTAMPLPKVCEKYVIVRDIILRDLMCGISEIDDPLTECMAKIEANLVSFPSSYNYYYSIIITFIIIIINNII